MFERYTDRAKRSVELAQEEAADLGHDSVGTGHLLLGLLGEGGGVAFQALDALGVTIEAAHEAVCQRHPTGNVGPSGWLRYTKRFRRVQELALREAIELGHNFIGTEHLLLGLIREGGGVGALAIADCGTAEGDRGFSEAVRAKVLELLRGYDDAERRATAPAEGARTRGMSKADHNAALDLAWLLDAGWLAEFGKSGEIDGIPADRPATYCATLRRTGARVSVTFTAASPGEAAAKAREWAEAKGAA
jgi:ATP-dependent Clp protease ATP-binding subunit ClpC